jgi:hypothetical protein
MVASKAVHIIARVLQAYDIVNDALTVVSAVDIVAEEINRILF